MNSLMILSGGVVGVALVAFVVGLTILCRVLIMTINRGRYGGFYVDFAIATSLVVIGTILFFNELPTILNRLTLGG